MGKMKIKTNDRDRRSPIQKVIDIVDAERGQGGPTNESRYPDDLTKKQAYDLIVDLLQEEGLVA